MTVSATGLGSREELGAVRTLNLVASSPARGIGLEPIVLSTDALLKEDP